MFRREALMDVGGFDESSVTEDFATSLKFHSKGWHSTYLNKVCAFGLGPEDLGGYFKQQYRWALGTVGLFRTILGTMISSPGLLSPGKWWEYFPFRHPLFRGVGLCHPHALPRPVFVRQCAELLCPPRNLPAVLFPLHGADPHHFQFFP